MKTRILITSLLILCVITLYGCGGDKHSIPQNTTATSPASQPATGPGGSEYAHASVVQNTYDTGDNQYWIFEPGTPAPANAPLVVFMHGWGAMDPNNTYILWINHIVKKGNIVVFPRYQASLLTNPATFTNNSVIAILNAITTLQSGGHVLPNLDCAVILGHSFGGVLTANLAAVAEERGLPIFKAAMCMEPGSAGFGVYEDFSKIDAATYLLCIAGENDTNVGDTDAKRIFNESTAIPKSRKDYILIYNDCHGTPPLNADHFIPGASDAASVNAYDWYGFWKWLDGLTEGVFYGRNLNYAIGKTAEQRYMGEWSDGIPVKQPLVTDSP